VSEDFVVGNAGEGFASGNAGEELVVGGASEELTAASADSFHDGVSSEEPSPDSSSPDGLTPSDRGRLPEATRKVLVQLLRGPYVSQERHANSWAVLLGAEDVIRERLGDLFLELVVDVDAGLAFVRNMESDEGELPRVIRSKRLTLVDTALVLFLREQLLNAEATGRRVFVGHADITDQMSVYRNLTQIDESGFNKRVRASIEKMKDQSVLLPTAEEDRFEVSPILRLVFNADQVIAVTKEIKRFIDEEAEGQRDGARVPTDQVAAHPLEHTPRSPAEGL
jgi:hypothetical protein